MIKILTANQIRALDAYTIEQGAIESIDLMERACRAFVNWFVERFDNQSTVGVVCGTGNNGGDGLGIARILHDLGYPVKVWIVRGSVPESPDFKINLARLGKNKVEILDVIHESDERFFDDRKVLIDAVFGSGLTRPVAGIYAKVIECVNKASAVKVSVDIPSGLMADSPSTGPVVKADFTVSFQLPKMPFFFPEYYPFVGEWILVDINLNKEFIRKADTHHYFVTQKDCRKILRKRSKFDHKGTFGHALLIAGSFGKMGATILASRAALRAGLGLLTVHVPKVGYTIVQTAVPEAMVSVDQNENFFSSPIRGEVYDTIGIGPGIGRDGVTVQAFRHLLEQHPHPMVIDADALNLLAENPDLLGLVPPGSILTPHPKEFGRLVGDWKDDFERMEKQKMLAAQLQSVIVLKGAFSSIAAPDGRIFFNPTGNPGMATGGTGDVLTGILTGLMAQDYESVNAAILGVYLHGLAGNLALPETGMSSLIASDIITFLPAAFLRLYRE